jgi:hypothetical protein
MIKQQAHNLIFFSFLCALENLNNLETSRSNSNFWSNISYIMEKWEKLIGCRPIYDGQTDDPFINRIKSKYKEIWVADREFTTKESCVLNYLVAFSKTHLRFNEVVDLFEKYIGSVDRITQEEYRHLHPLSLEKWNVYIGQNLREINLKILENDYKE